jgi:hypothetical protein
MMSLDKLPRMAEVVMQTGHYAGHKIALESTDQTLDKPFRYHDPRARSRLNWEAAVRRLPWLGRLALHPHRLPHRLAQPDGALFGWWYAFTWDLRRERGFTMEDMPVRAYSDQAASAAAALRPRPANTRDG